MPDDRIPDAFLPLTAVAFEIMLALADGPRHGYDIMQRVEHASGGTITLHPGTLYRALNRLLTQSLIDEVGAPSQAPVTDERRRYYVLTALGRQVASREAERLAQQVRTARAKRLLPGKLP